MSLFNVVVYSEEGKIKIKIEQVSAVVQDDSPAEPVVVSIKSFQSVNFKEGQETNPKIPVFLENELAVTRLERITFKAIDGLEFGLSDKQDVSFYRDAVIYELPSEPNEFMNFLRVVSEFARYQCTVAMLSLNRSVDTAINEGRMKGGICSFFGDGFYPELSPEDKFKLRHSFIFNILNLDNISTAYQKPLACLKNFMDLSINMDRKNERLNKNTTLVNFMLSGRNPNDLLNPSVSEQEKKQLIADLHTTFTKANETEKLAHLFTTMNNQAITALYQRCIGVQAPDGGQYRFTYTEWHFLRHAEFIMRSDGRMSIIGLSNNKGYQEYYADGQRLHKKFENEMRQLGNIIGLEFAEDCDFHKELIFTEQCTQELKSKGLHYNSHYLAKTLQKESFAQAPDAFFQPKIVLPDQSEVLQPTKEINFP